MQKTEAAGRRVCHKPATRQKTKEEVGKPQMSKRRLTYGNLI